MSGQPNPNQAAVTIDNIVIEELVVCPCDVNAAFAYQEGNCVIEFFDASSAGADPSNQILGYSWDFGDGNYGNGETVTHVYDSLGTYVACLTVYCQDPVTGDCCSHQVCIDVPALLNVEQNQIDLGSVEVYPNPSTGVFNVKIKKDRVESIEVYTLGGQFVNDLEIIKGKKVSTINATNCASGMYMVMIVSESGDIYSTKLSIE